MPSNTRILDAKSRHAASVVKHNDMPYGLNTYTHPYEHYQYDVQYLVSEENGKDMAVTPPSVTSTTLIHNGGDTVGWTASNHIGSGFNFASATQVRTGLAAINGTATAHNDTAAFVPGAPINPTGFSYVRLYIYFDTFSTQGTDKDILFGWVSGGTEVGVKLSIKAYADTTRFGSWLQVDIPMVDFQIGTATVDEFRISVVDLGAGVAPDFYVDDMVLISTASATGAVNYEWVPEYGNEYYLTGVRFTAVTTGKTSLNSSEFFGITALANGLELVYRNENTVFKAFDAIDVFDFLSWGDVHSEAFGTVNNVTIILEFAIPLGHFKVSGTNLEKILVRIRDDLSGIDKLNCSLTLAKIDRESVQTK